jgi:hypothetical protein
MHQELEHTMNLRFSLPAALLAVAVSAGSAGRAHAQSPPSLVGAMAAVAEERLRTVERAAELMPEADYGFMPVKGVRTFGELVAHVADTNRAFCSALAGAREPIGAEVEKTVHAKAAIVDALKAADAMCHTALAGLTDAALPAPRAFGGGALLDGTQIPVRDLPAGLIVTLLTSHTEREYGKLTIYLRAKNLVPPTSQPRGQ